MGDFDGFRLYFEVKVFKRLAKVSVPPALNRII